MKLKASAVTTSQPPKSSSVARRRSVRGAAHQDRMPTTSEHEGRGQQPGDLAADLVLEQPEDAGRAPHAARRRCAAAAAGDAARLVRR